MGGVAAQMMQQQLGRSSPWHFQPSPHHHPRRRHHGQGVLHQLLFHRAPFFAMTYPFPLTALAADRKVFQYTPAKEKNSSLIKIPQLLDVRSG